MDANEAGPGGGGALWIDVGGTFTDCLLWRQGRPLRSCKVLSSGVVKATVLERKTDLSIRARLSLPVPGFYRGYECAFIGGERGGAEIFRSTLRDSDPLGSDEPAEHGNISELTFIEPIPDWIGEGTPIELSSGEPAPILAARQLLGLRMNDPIRHVEVRLGTTRATNALLERKGARTAWITTQGFRDVLAIGNQDRPRLFDLRIEKPPPLYEEAVELPGRLDAEGRILQPLDEKSIRATLLPLRERGIRSLAVGLLHAYRNDIHESMVRRVALEAGFEQVSISSQVSPTIKLVSRGATTVVDAYLTPVLRDYLKAIQSSLGGSRLRVMTSAGALASASAIGGKDAILSGPAGGVIGLAAAAAQAELKHVIGFDMGGTSTDVSRFDGALEYEFETVKAGVRLVTPMIAIETVAAGGGSICDFDGQKLTVGPESAGALPGPACYGRGGPLAVTDINFFSGRLLSDRFPFVLDRPAVELRLRKMRERIAGSAGRDLEPENIAEGYLRIANAHMAAAIQKISVAKGYDLRSYTLVSFGGAAGQHACAVARELGIHRVLVHPLASVFSAYGMGMAKVSKFAVRPVMQQVTPGLWIRLGRSFEEVGAELSEELRREGESGSGDWKAEHQLEVRYLGQSSTLTTPFGNEDEVRASFEALHLQLYGHIFEGRPLEIVNARTQVTVPGSPHGPKVDPENEHRPSPAFFSEVLFNGAWVRTPVHARDGLNPGAIMQGPAIVYDEHSVIIIDPGWSAKLTGIGNLMLEDRSAEDRSVPVDTSEVVSSKSLQEASPIDLEIFNNHFSSIAEQMGATLQRTALSVNVRDRLDFSCALFTAEGDLVANAPHVPVHLGAMSECVKCVIQDVPDLAPGDVILTNDPMRGGSHLPDLTVVTPVFCRDLQRIEFFTASRAHHAEIGGIRPGSMPPDSRNLAEEGVVIRHFKVVEGGQPRLEDLKRLLSGAAYPSRAPEENLADISAQIAANHQGAEGLRGMMLRFGHGRTLAYMRHIQTAAEAKMRTCLRSLGDGNYEFADAMDDGSEVRVRISILDGGARVDFTGSASVHPGNLNANRAIVMAAVIYSFRCILGEDVPLNSGFLAPIEIVLPEGMLNPPGRSDPRACPAVVGGNVETSQKIVDVILGALGVAAASQGTMNNFIFGNERISYYETICGGAGAGPGFAGANAVHTHMTNTRLTDAEVLESRFPVRVRRFGIREGSGGAGDFPGGCGVVREIEFLEPLEVSLLTQRRLRAPYGKNGGGPGATGRNRLFRAGGGQRDEGEDLGPIACFEARPGDRLLIETPGGGGWGSIIEPQTKIRGE